MKQKQNEAYAKIENGKYAYHTVHRKGRAKGGREGTETEGTEVN